MFPTGGYGGYWENMFEQRYRCHPVPSLDRPHLESGDKIMMPPSALDRLASVHVDYPMLFQLRNSATGRVSHCGVLEFTAEEGMVYVPRWMMANMLLREGDTVEVKNATLPKGSYVRLQPHTKDFLHLSDPKAILETALRSFSCFTTGDSIMVAYNNKEYYIDIVETKPSSAVCIIETDCEVDFAPPLEHQEPAEPPAGSTSSSKVPVQDQEVAVQPEPKFSPFTGIGRRLDGKPSQHQGPSEPSDQAETTINGKHSTGTTSHSDPRPPTGKLVFGSHVTPKDKHKASTKGTKGEPPMKEEPKFQAFTGNKYTLRG